MHVQVSIRLRPPVAHVDDGDVTESEEIRLEEGGQCLYRNHRFQFAHAFGAGCTNEEVYGAHAAAVENVLRGFDCTLMVYGQTGSGKTHTMMGAADGSEPGIVPMAFDSLFEAILSRSDETSFSLRLSVLEILEERCVDLLHGRTSVVLRSTGSASNKGGLQFFGLREVTVRSKEQLMAEVERGKAARTVGSNYRHDCSSRAHTIVRLCVEAARLVTVDASSSGGSKETLTGTSSGVLTLVDLAGSEAASQNSSAALVSQGIAINKSLHWLKVAVHDLAAKKAVVPFRNSAITRLLQPSLAGQAVVAVLVTAALLPGVAGARDTLEALMFGEEVGKLKLAPTKNTQVDAAGQVRLLCFLCQGAQLHLRRRRSSPPGSGWEAAVVAGADGRRQGCARDGRRGAERAAPLVRGARGKSGARIQGDREGACIPAKRGRGGLTHRTRTPPAPAPGRLPPPSLRAEWTAHRRLRSPWEIPHRPHAKPRAAQALFEETRRDFVSAESLSEAARSSALELASALERSSALESRLGEEQAAREALALQLRAVESEAGAVARRNAELEGAVGEAVSGRQALESRLGEMRRAVDESRALAEGKEAELGAQRRAEALLRAQLEALEARDASTREAAERAQAQAEALSARNAETMEQLARLSIEKESLATVAQAKGDLLILKTKLYRSRSQLNRPENRPGSRPGSASHRAAGGSAAHHGAASAGPSSLPSPVCSAAAAPGPRAAWGAGPGHGGAWEACEQASPTRQLCGAGEGSDGSDRHSFGDAGGKAVVTVIM